MNREYEAPAQALQQLWDKLAQLGLDRVASTRPSRRLYTPETSPTAKPRNPVASTRPPRRLCNSLHCQGASDLVFQGSTASALLLSGFYAQRALNGKHRFRL